MEDDYTSSWCQGHLLPEAMVHALTESESSLPAEWSPKDLLIAFTHSCDLVSQDYAAEPYVEVLRAMECAESDRNGNLAWGKNPRRFQFEADLGAGTRWYEIFVHDKAEFDRKWLARWQPSPSLAVPPHAMDMLATWRAKRYSRRASPDEFNKRVAPSESRLRGFLKIGGTYASGLYIVTQDVELPAGEPYVVLVVATMRVDDYLMPERREEAEAALSRVGAALDKLDGVDCQDWKVMSEGDVSIADVHGMTRWDLDDLSLRAEPVQALPPDELR